MLFLSLQILFPTQWILKCYYQRKLQQLKNDFREAGTGVEHKNFNQLHRFRNEPRFIASLPVVTEELQVSTLDLL